MKIEPCPVCKAKAVLFNRPENRVGQAEMVRTYRWLKENIPGFLYCHVNPHPGQKNLIWHVFASNNPVSCRMVVGPLIFRHG